MTHDTHHPLQQTGPVQQAAPFQQTAAWPTLPTWSSPARHQPAPAGLNHVLLRGHLERAGKLCRRGPRDTLIYEGTLNIPDPTDPNPASQSRHTVPFYLTGHHAAALQERARPGQALELNGLIHQERWTNAAGDHVRTRIKTLRCETLPCERHGSGAVNSVTLGGTLRQVSRVTGHPHGLRAVFVLDVESRYLLKNGTEIVHTDTLDLRAHYGVARQLLDFAPGQVVTVLAAAFNNARQERRALSFLAVQVRTGLTPTWTN